MTLQQDPRIQQNEFVLKQLVIPKIHQKFVEGKPHMYKIYNGNACRQTAFIVQQWMSDAIPEMEFEIWEGLIADDEVQKKYEHAWVLGTTRKGKKKELLLIDLPMHTEQTFAFVKKHEFPNPKIQVLNKKRLNPSKMAELEEFYTDKPGKILFQEVVNEIGTELMEIAYRKLVGEVTKE